MQSYRLSDGKGNDGLIIGWAMRGERRSLDWVGSLDGGTRSGGGGEKLMAGLDWGRACG